MRVLVTGGTGSVGRETTARLVRSGWDVRVAGRREGIEIEGAEYVVCDVTDMARVREVIAGCDAVVHLAAIASPIRYPSEVTFGSNVTGTFHVFEAAAKAGIRRVVQASSINAFGCFWAMEDMRLEYLPIDEAHPTYTVDPYSYSKQAIESIGEYFWRRDGISSVALRLPWVHHKELLEKDDFRERVRKGRALLAELASLDPAEREQRMAAARRACMDYRGRRALEHDGHATDEHKNSPPDTDLARMYTYDRFNFWAFLDERDSAGAIEKALTAEYEGAHTLFVNDDQNWLLANSRHLAEFFFPGVGVREDKMAGSDTLVSIERAKELIGFEVEYSVTALA